ncbi:MAG: gliding motility-associated C-terminal domain-containing protein [Pyrinomonadaceae bacterium]|nr:gliding motility-associated C-terminal domain-containing protein [Sphingobacteriaceae bacterium]
MRDFFLVFIFVVFGGIALGQCPTNLDFELGNFTGWTCETGNRINASTTSFNPISGPVANRHTILTNSSNLDPIGKFPLSTPDNSSFFIKLGNNSDGAEAERISYTFTVPTNDFSIVYNYAAVFKYDVAETGNQKPAFTVKVKDAFGFYLPCISVEKLADFSTSTPSSNVLTEAHFTPWTTASINLAGYGGMTVTLEFTTLDCHFNIAASDHYEYVYLDINASCNPAVKGNLICNPASVTLTAPPGFVSYNWYDSFANPLGTGQTLAIFSPTAGTNYAVQAIPEAGLSCAQTFTTTILPGTPISVFNFPPVINSCVGNPVNLQNLSLTAGSDLDLGFEYFQNAAASIKLTNPGALLTAGTYHIKATNTSNCFETKAVTVAFYPNTLVITNPPVTYMPFTVDITQPAIRAGSSASLTPTYWADPGATIPISDPTKINASGTYYIKGTNPGCSVIMPVVVTVNSNVPNTFSPNGDGLNDNFKVFNVVGIKTNYFKIFNRYGKVVFESSGAGAWDGTHEGKKVPVGYYYWIWDAIDLNTGKIIHNSGSLNLIR